MATATAQAGTNRLEAWRTAWREHIGPALTTGELEAAARALQSDDPRLLQKSTCFPPPVERFFEEPCEGGCLVSFAVWGGTNATVQDVHRRFTRVRFLATRSAGSRRPWDAFIFWFDHTRRGEMRRAMLPEVKRLLARRMEEAAEPVGAA